MSPLAEKRLQARDKVVDVLTKFVGGELSALIAARRLMSARDVLMGDVLDDDWRPFVAADSDSDDLPLGEERKYWAPEALARKDKEIADREFFYRPLALSAAHNLLRRYQEPNQPPQTTTGSCAPDRA